ncbi:MAG TPA: N-acetylmuramidase domain-containing protein [Anaerolineales bacterium]|nr:N-acetylmuramidase domain-containing protein [Anaerolineales bacterium]
MAALKVGPHVCTGPTGLATWLEAGCATVKYFATFPSDHPRGALVIGRAHNTDHLSPEHGDAVQVARAWWAHRIGPVARANRHIAQVWEGSNENHWSYDWSLERMQAALRWYGEFDYELARLMRSEGFALALGGWAVTTPGRTGSRGENLNDLWPHYTRALDAIVEFGGYFHRHCYGPLDEVFALRHRADHRSFEALGYLDIPMLLSEVGAEKAGGMMPWRVEFGDDPARYMSEWVAPFERHIRADDYVIGAHLFSLGDSGGWRNYNVAGSGPGDIPARMASLSRELGPVVTRMLAPRKLTPRTARYTVTAGDGLRLRSAGSLQAPILELMPFGAVVEALDGQAPGWWRVFRGGRTGWCSSAYLAPVPVESVPEASAPTHRVTAIAGLIVRDAAAKASNRIGALPLGSAVVVTAQPSGEYWPIVAGALSGWASRYYLAPIAPSPAPAKVEATTPAQAMAELAPQYGIPLSVAMAVLRIEAGGVAFKDGRQIIRVEAHVLKREIHAADWSPRFQVGVGGVAQWDGVGHRMRSSLIWIPYHGDQEKEYQALALASQVSVEKALRSTSMGCAQVMGFNHKAVGYVSATTMFEAFSKSARAQVKAMLDYCKSRGVIATLQRGDFLEFAKAYNGSEQAPRYARLLEQAARLNGWSG